MFTFTKLNAIAIAPKAKSHTGKYVARVRIEGATKAREARAALAAAGYAEDRPKASNWVWVVLPEGGCYERHFADKAKRDAVVQAINDAHAPKKAAPKKDAPKKAAPKKAEPKAKTPEQELRELFELSARINARIAELIG